MEVYLIRDLKSGNLCGYGGNPNKTPIKVYTRKGDAKGAIKATRNGYAQQIDPAIETYNLVLIKEEKL